jgi:raffinose/stachyose/melibiose transport system substrate-binding protein
MRTTILATLAAILASSGNAVELTIESWRTDDLRAWQEEIIPVFEARHPDITVRFSPSPEYRTALGARLAGGTAGDLVTCESFDGALGLYEDGHLANLTDLPGMTNFPAAARAAWQTDDGAVTYCVPMGAVIHGFIYNRDIFAQLGIAVPETEADFYAALARIKADGQYIPLGMGTANQFEAGILGYDNIGPNYWKGEEGRLALINGEQRLTDPQWVEPFAALARWGEFLGDGYEAQTYHDSQNLFTLGRVAVYPAGSWEITGFNRLAGFGMGAFKPPVRDPGDTCYIADHFDQGLGLNAASPNAAAALKFLVWVASPEFATVYGNALPGFFPLSTAPVELADPLAREFLGWRDECASTIRHAYQFLSRGTPNLDTETWSASVAAIKGTATPAELGARLQEGLAGWYVPRP